jgi:dynein heavy chain, axonemal
MGATSRLVITPLTDRCWITISGALHIKLGANPSGPAGTGKTESTKDLAKCIACLCIVFNCSDQVDYKMMGRLFSGLCQQGAWTCLDEFNRIGVEVLSVIGQQLLTIREALLAGKAGDKFNFMEKNIALKADFGCHVTMNPGYAGRTELPDNLKVLFRPVSMMIPNYGLIAEIMLFAEGFGNGTELSKKMVNLYKLSSEQLSQQYHYDFGMRAVKSVLVMAGALKRAHMDMPEDAVLIRAMRDANVPKFLEDDLPLFAAIIRDLFPTVELINPDYSKLLEQISASTRKLGWQTNANFMQKIIYLYETFNVRFGVMLVGPTGGGKTAVYEVLADVMTTLRAANHPDRSFQTVHK